MANTKKVETKAPAKGAKKEKLTLTAMILGYIGCVALIAGFFFGSAIFQGEGIDLTMPLIILLVTQLIAIAGGIVLLVKAIKVDNAYGPKQKKFNLAFGIISIVAMILLIVVIVLGLVGVELGNFGAILGFAWVILGEAACLAPAIANTVWFAKRNKGAKKAAK